MGGTGSVIDLLGVYDNLHDPVPMSNERGTILGFIITFLILSWTCGLLRLYVRFFVIYSPGWDDLFLFLYMCSSMLGSVLTCILPNYGLGQHFLLQTYDVMMDYLKLFWIANATYVMSTTFIKLSLLFQYLRVFEQGRQRWFCMGILIFTALWGFSYSFIAWVPCMPIARFWNPLYVSGTCWAYGGENAAEFIATFESHSGFNMILDIIVLSIPIPLYFKEGTAAQAKRGLLLLMFMGSIVVFISIWRLQTLIQHRAATSPTFDPTWYAPLSLILSAIEVDMASICASAPVFWPVFRAQVTKIFVVEEIEITHEHRVDQFELHRRDGSQSLHSPSGSEIGLGPGPDALDRTISKKKHYEDEFVRDQVDPFSKIGKEEATVQVHVRSGSVRSGSQGPPLSRNIFPKFT